MRKLLIALLIAIAIFAVVPMALGYGFGLAGGELSPTLWSNVTEYEVSGDGNYVVSVNGDNAEVTSYAKEMPMEPETRGDFLPGVCWGVLGFLLMASVLIGGMVVIGRNA